MSLVEQRVRVERRLLRDRRRGLDRRIVDRRLHAVPVAGERRGNAERRASEGRRSPVSRRSWIDRRGAGSADQPTLVTP